MTAKIDTYFTWRCPVPQCGYTVEETNISCLEARASWHQRQHNKPKVKVTMTVAKVKYEGK